MGIFQDFINSRPDGFRTENIAHRELTALRDQGDPLAPPGFSSRPGWAILKKLGMTNLDNPPPQGQLIGHVPQDLDYQTLPLSPATALIMANQISIDDKNRRLEDELIFHLNLLHYFPDLLPTGALGVLLDEIGARLWLRPQVGGLEGFNAITGAVDFDVIGTPVVGMGRGDQEILTFDDTQRLVSNGNLTGCPFTRIDEDAKFWVYFYTHPQGDTSNKTVVFNGAAVVGDPGFRVIFDGEATVRIEDEFNTNTLIFSAPIVPYDNNSPTCYLINFDFENNECTAYVDGSAIHLSSKNKRSFINPPTEFPIDPIKPLTIGSTDSESQLLSYEGDLMVAMGVGLVPDDIAVEMTRLGIGHNIFALTKFRPNCIILQRNIVHSETSFSVVGKYRCPVRIRLYAEGGEGSRGAEVITSPVLAQDSFGRSEHTFTGLTADTVYHVITVAGDLEDLSEGRVKMPLATRAGAKFTIAGDWTKPNDIIESSILNLVLANFEKDRVVISTGDDGYLDNAHQRLHSVSPPIVPTTLSDYDAAEVDELDDFRVMPMWQRFLYTPGPWSDHDAFGNDLDGSATNKAVAQQFHRIRYGNTLSYETNDQTYHSFILNGCRFIVTDQRSEREDGVNMFDSTQKTWIGAEIAAAVAADQVIFLMIEQPINRVAPTPPIDWELLTTERTEVWDLVIDNGGEDQTIIIVGDYHGRGIDLTAGPFGTDGVTTLPIILSARLQHSFAEAVSGDWPDYWNNNNYGYLKLDITENLPAVTVTVTPVITTTEGTPVDIDLTIA